jgi:hypothetical protein
MAKFIYKRLKSYPGFWRVDGVGEIRDRGRLGAGVSVHFSEILESELHAPYRTQARSGQTLSLPVHSATLTEFKVGTIWKDGALTYTPPQLDKSVTIDVSRCRIVRLGEHFELNTRHIDTALPEPFYRLGDNRERLKNTFYAVVPVLGDPITDWLVTPCSELLRFYYGVTSRLLSSTLRGRIGDYVSWDKSRFEDAKLILHVTQRLNRKEAAVLARAAASTDAKSALHGVHNHLASIHANNKVLAETSRKPLTIKARFPFTDKTVLAVAGKRMKMTNARVGEKYDRWGVFAMQILRCTHPFEFVSSVIESDEPLSEGGQSPIGGLALPSEYPFLDDEQSELEVDDVPANARLKRLAILDYSNQFSAMDGMRFQHARPLGGNSANTPGSAAGVPVNALSFGEGSHAEDAKNTLGAGSYQNKVEQVDRDITIFLKMLQCMREKVARIGWTIRTRTLKDKLIEGNDSIALFPMNLGKARTWHKIVEANGNVRPRQVVIAEVSTGSPGKVFYLLEMELKASENGQCTILLHSKDLTVLKNETFETLFKLTAIQNRWIDQRNKWKKIRDEEITKAFFSHFCIHRINHPPVPRKKPRQEHQAPEFKIDPLVWSEALLEKFTEIFSQGVT